MTLVMSATYEQFLAATQPTVDSQSPPLGAAHNDTIDNADFDSEFQSYFELAYENIVQTMDDNNIKNDDILTTFENYKTYELEKIVNIYKNILYELELNGENKKKLLRNIYAILVLFKMEPVRKICRNEIVTYHEEREIIDFFHRFLRVDPVIIRRGKYRESDLFLVTVFNSGYASMLKRVAPLIKHLNKNGVTRGISDMAEIYSDIRAYGAAKCVLSIEGYDQLTHVSFDKDNIVKFVNFPPDNTDQMFRGATDFIKSVAAATDNAAKFSEKHEKLDEVLTKVGDAAASIESLSDSINPKKIIGSMVEGAQSTIGSIITQLKTYLDILWEVIMCHGWIILGPIIMAIGMMIPSGKKLSKYMLIVKTFLTMAGSVVTVSYTGDYISEFGHLFGTEPLPNLDWVASRIYWNLQAKRPWWSSIYSKRKFSEFMAERVGVEHLISMVFSCNLPETWLKTKLAIIDDIKKVSGYPDAVVKFTRLECMEPDPFNFQADEGLIPLIATFYCSQGVDFSKKGEIINALKNISPISKGIEVFVSSIVTFVLKITELISRWTGMDVGFGEWLDKEYSTWRSAALKFLADAKTDIVPVDHNGIRELEILEDLGYTISKRLRSENISMAGACDNLIRKIVDLRTVAIARLKDAGMAMVEPICVCLVGDAGVGKSGAVAFLNAAWVQFICSDNDLLLEQYKNNPSAFSYTRSADSWMDGYTSLTQVMNYDDMGSVTPTSSSDSRWVEIIDAVNIIRKPIAHSEADKKGDIKFGHSLVTISTNLNKMDDPHVGFQPAIMRRLHFTYRITNTTPQSVSKMNIKQFDPAVYVLEELSTADHMDFKPTGRTTTLALLFKAMVRSYRQKVEYFNNSTSHVMDLAKELSSTDTNLSLEEFMRCDYPSSPDYKTANGKLVTTRESMGLPEGPVFLSEEHYRDCLLELGKKNSYNPLDKGKDTVDLYDPFEHAEQAFEDSVVDQAGPIVDVSALRRRFFSDLNQDEDQPVRQFFSQGLGLRTTDMIHQEINDYCDSLDEMSVERDDENVAIYRKRMEHNFVAVPIMGYEFTGSLAAELGITARQVKNLRYVYVPTRMPQISIGVKYNVVESANTMWLKQTISRPLGYLKEKLFKLCGLLTTFSDSLEDVGRKLLARYPHVNTWWCRIKVWYEDMVATMALGKSKALSLLTTMSFPIVVLDCLVTGFQEAATACFAEFAKARNSFHHYMVKARDWIIANKAKIIAVCGIIPIIATGLKYFLTADKGDDEWIEDQIYTDHKRYTKKNSDRVKAKKFTMARQAARDKKESQNEAYGLPIDESVVEVVGKNVYELYMNTTKVGYALAIGGRDMVILNHYLTAARKTSDDLQWTFKKPGTSIDYFSLPFTKIEVYDSDESMDYAFVRVPDLPEQRQIRKHISTHADQGRLMTDRVNTIGLWKPGVLWGVDSKILAREDVVADQWLLSTSTWNLTAKERVRTDDGWVERVNLISYKIPTKNGMCGTPIFAGNKIVGIHSAGNGIWGHAAKLILEKNVSALAGMEPSGELSRSDLDDRYDLAGVTIIDENTVFNALPYNGDVHNGVPIGYTDKPTSVFVKRDMVKISSNNPDFPLPKREPVMTQPRMYANARVGYNPNVDVIFDRDIMEAVKRVMGNQLSELAEGYSMAPLKWSNVIMGDQDGIKAMESSTSPGFPYNVTGVKTKNFWSVGQDKLALYPNGAKLFARLKTIESLCGNGTVPLLPFTDNLKYELRKPTKVEEPRLVSGAAIEQTMLLKKYYGPLYKILTKNVPRNSTLIGVNPVKDWDEMVKSFRDYGGVDRHGAGDYSGWDKRLTAILFDELYEVMEYAFGDQGLFGSTEEAKYNARVRKSLLDSSTESVHIRGEIVEMWEGSWASGNYLTAGGNSLLNQMLFMYIYTKNLCINNGLKKEQYHGAAETYFGNVYARFMGDDNRFAVRKGFEWFNMKLLEKELSTLGMVYTSTSKNDIEYELQDVSEMNILKRYDVFNEELGRWVGALDTNTLVDMMWYTIIGKEEEVLTQRADVFARELSLWGRQKFDELFPAMLKHCGDKIRIPWTNYDQVIHQVDGDAFFDDGQIW
jgi:hypothetical protein